MKRHPRFVHGQRVCLYKDLPKQSVIMPAIVLWHATKRKRIETVFEAECACRKTSTAISRHNHEPKPHATNYLNEYAPLPVPLRLRAH